ncbi:fmn-dependent dehydrogenase [Ophiostoma piceae UAMH 11346]|uniref:Fmn-dependent dehydrogenase n=1 Tax=Ophiostoma piceae (strain UAMH 11346) TaxID=1262450 RepID=S3CER6_OPHP1|nr:fmn-dependent dehydrogenase [Ophiostoma piceae UAMH 11346]
MADSQPPPVRSPPYADYLYGLYRGRLLADQPPITTTDPVALEEQARKAMHDRPAAFGYIAGGAGSGSTMTANRRALDSWALVPRIMRSPRSATEPGADLRTTLFGNGGKIPPIHLQSPVVMAPVGVQSAYHPDRELGTAAACAELDVPYCISTASSSTIEEIAEAIQSANDESSAWYQLYWPKDDEITASLLSRARASGCRVLVVTVDTFTISWRPTDLDAGYLPFITTGEGNAIGFSDPIFRKKLAEDGEEGEEPATPESSPLAAALRWTSEAFPRHGRPWADLATLRRLWGDDGAILIKGVLHPEDALLARKYGADGVVVSNHGGRQVDGAVASLAVLPEVVKAVRDAENGDRNRHSPFTILFDSGIRTGADVVKAVCLGAQAVLVGRPVIYGLGIAGQEGAKHVLAGLLADLDQTMSLIGCASLADLGPHMLRPQGLEFKSSL